MPERTEQKGIFDVRRDYEQRTGKPLCIYKAYPEIGRGGVDHELPSHADVSRIFDRALNMTILDHVLDFFRARRLIPYAN